MVQAAVIREISQGVVPQRQNITGNVTFNLMKSEQLVWVIQDVDYLETVERRERRRTSHGVSVRVARGLYYRPSIFRSRPIEWEERSTPTPGGWACTTKHIYFAGSRKRFRVRYDKIVAFDPYEDGLTNATFEYQWIAGEEDISGATGSSHLLTTSEQGQTVQVKVTFTDDANNQETLTSAATVAVAPKPNSEPTGLPAITSPPQVGQTLTADTSAIADEDGLTNVSYRYQWIARGSDISGATGASHTLTAAEEGQTIQARVDFTDDAGNAESLTSAATVAVAPKPVPLTASFSNVPAAHDGSAFTFDLSFSENVKAGYERVRDDAFNVTGGDITQAQRKEQGSNQNWTITVQPSGNDAITITLPPTTDCDATGAICDYDGDMLSDSTSVQVAGPE